MKKCVVVSEKKAFDSCSHKVLCKTMSCDGGHLSFLIDTRKTL